MGGRTTLPVSTGIENRLLTYQSVAGSHRQIVVFQLFGTLNFGTWITISLAELFPVTLIWPAYGPGAHGCGLFTFTGSHDSSLGPITVGDAWSARAQPSSPGAMSAFSVALPAAFPVLVGMLDGTQVISVQLPATDGFLMIWSETDQKTVVSFAL